MTMTFKIALLSTGPDPDDWDSLSDILSFLNIPVEPEPTYEKYSVTRDLLDGSRKGNGFSKASWRLKLMRDYAREILRPYCPGLSNEVYITTSTNEVLSGAVVWVNLKTQMLWAPGSEDRDTDATLDTLIEFRHGIEVV